MLFKQRSARLYNGTKVKEGDRVMFVNYEGEECTDVIRRNINKPKQLYFWNKRFAITDYKSAVKL